jgi:hypothetical protein
VFEANSGKHFKRHYLEKPFTKNRDGGMTEGEGPEFKPQYRKKKITCIKCRGVGVGVQTPNTKHLMNCKKSVNCH